MQILPETEEEFKQLRNPLLTYFSGRGLSPAEDYADEVIMRVLSKINAGEKIEDIKKYTFGVAKFVRLETYKEPAKVSIDSAGAIDSEYNDGNSRAKIPKQLIIEAPKEEGESLHSNCLKKCLGELKPEKRAMILAFYEIGDFDDTYIDKRKEIAIKYQMSIDTLYTNISRQRKKVGECTKKCAAE